jgi:hypothetical protein
VGKPAIKSLAERLEVNLRQFFAQNKHWAQHGLIHEGKKFFLTPNCTMGFIFWCTRWKLFTPSECNHIRTHLLIELGSLTYKSN